MHARVLPAVAEIARRCKHMQHMTAAAAANAAAAGPGACLHHQLPSNIRAVVQQQ
jgi:hypothetical protein